MGFNIDLRLFNPNPNLDLKLQIQLDSSPKFQIPIPTLISIISLIMKEISQSPGGISMI